MDKIKKWWWSHSSFLWKWWDWNRNYPSFCVYSLPRLTTTSWHFLWDNCHLGSEHNQPPYFITKLGLCGKVRITKHVCINQKIQKHSNFPMKLSYFSLVIWVPLLVNVFVVYTNECNLQTEAACKKSPCGGISGRINHTYFVK